MRTVGISLLLACSFISVSPSAEAGPRRTNPFPAHDYPWLRRLVRDFSVLQNYQAYADMASKIAVQSNRVQQNIPKTVLDSIRSSTGSYSHAALISPVPFIFDEEVRSRLSLSVPNVVPAIFQTLVESATAVEDDVRETQEDQNRMGAQIKRVREYASFMRNLANSPSNSLSVRLFNDDCGAPTNFFTTRLALEFESLPDCNFVTSQVIDKSQIALLADDLSERLTVMEQTFENARKTFSNVMQRRNEFVAQIRLLQPVVQSIKDSDIQQIR
jgi:hypothetical protein